jgi:hypothetical protein
MLGGFVMKRFIINMLERLRVKKSERENIDVALTVASDTTEDASFSEDTTVNTSQGKDDDVKLSLPRSCMNCEEVLTGPYCFSCGQKEGDIRRPIWSLLGELLDNVVAPDSKLFKTLLLLLFMPGKLTGDYNRGRRARFIPPLRLYITITFAFFALLLITDVLILDISFTKKEDIINQDRVSEIVDDALDDIILEPSGSFGVDVDQIQQNDTQQAINDFIKEVQNGKEASIEVAQSQDPSQTQGQAKVQSLAQLQEEEHANEIEAIDEEVAALKSLFSDDWVDELEDQIEDLTEFEDSLPGLATQLRDRFGNRLQFADTELSVTDRKDIATFLTAEMTGIPEVAKSAVVKAIISGRADDDIKYMLSGGKPKAALRINEDNIGFSSGEFPYNVSFGMFVKRSDEERDTVDAEDLKKWVTSDDSPEEAENLVNNFADAMKDPRKFNELFNDWLPQTLFVMVPFFALILRLFHWGKKRFYFNQLIFSLHFHSFLFLIFIGFIFIIPITGAELAGPIFWILSSLYIIVALKYGQDQGWIKAFLKAGFVWVSYAFILTSTLFAAVMFGLSGGSFGDLIAVIF